MMTIAQIMEKMIAFSEGNIHDITHLSCVWTYAKTIGELERVDEETQFILEVAPSPRYRLPALPQKVRQHQQSSPYHGFRRQKAENQGIEQWSDRGQHGRFGRDCSAVCVRRCQDERGS